MADHPATKHLEKLAELHKRTREHHHSEAVRMTADREVVDRQRADLLAGKVGGTDEPGSDHGSG